LSFIGRGTRPFSSRIDPPSLVHGPRRFVAQARNTRSIASPSLRAARALCCAIIESIRDENGLDLSNDNEQKEKRLTGLDKLHICANMNFMSLQR
jgi:hypothetical protein